MDSLQLSFAQTNIITFVPLTISLQNSPDSEQFTDPFLSMYGCHES